MFLCVYKGWWRRWRWRLGGHGALSSAAPGRDGGGVRKPRLPCRGVGGGGSGGPWGAASWDPESNESNVCCHYYHRGLHGNQASRPPRRHAGRYKRGGGTRSCQTDSELTAHTGPPAALDPLSLTRRCTGASRCYCTSSRSAAATGERPARLHRDILIKSVSIGLSGHTQLLYHTDGVCVCVSQ